MKNAYLNDVFTFKLCLCTIQKQKIYILLINRKKREENK